MMDDKDRNRLRRLQDQICAIGKRMGYASYVPIWTELPSRITLDSLATTLEPDYEQQLKVLLSEWEARRW